MSDMLKEGTLTISQEEISAVDKLRGEHPDGNISLTRRDAGDTGPLLVHVDSDTYQIGEDGKRKKVT